MPRVTQTMSRTESQARAAALLGTRACFLLPSAGVSFSDCRVREGANPSWYMCRNDASANNQPMSVSRYIEFQRKNLHAAIIVLPLLFLEFAEVVAARAMEDEALCALCAANGRAIDRYEMRFPCVRSTWSESCSTQHSDSGHI